MLVHDPSAVTHIVDSLIRFDTNGQRPPDDAALFQIYEKALSWAQSKNIAAPASIVAESHFVRGRLFFGKEQYEQAAIEFQAARHSADTNSLTYATAGLRLWFTRNRLADKLRDQGDAPAALLSRLGNLLDIDPDVRQVLALRNLNDDGLWLDIGRIYADSTERTSADREVTECDRLASFDFDPYRVSPGVGFDVLDARRALDACDNAVTTHPDAARFRYLRGRAHFRAGTLASTAKDEAAAKTEYAAALTDYKAAMAQGYPAAFNNVGLMMARGLGIESDPAGAADFYLQALNRVVYCCATPAVQELLAKQGNYSVKDVHRACRELLSWAAALGSSEARTILTTLVSNGTLDATDIPRAAQFTDRPPWLKEIGAN